MSLMSKALPLMAALAAGAAYAQPAPSGAPNPAPAAPAAPAQAVQKCPMVNGHAMMSGRAMGAHMQDGHMVDKDGKLIMGGMMGPHGMMCVPQASANTQSPKAPPKATQ